MSGHRLADDFLRRVRAQENITSIIILHYDPTSADLRAWTWYVATVVSIAYIS